MRLIGHRGCMAQFPENTIRAVREVAPHVDLVEIDVTRCGTGELVVFHDDTLERLTGAEGEVSETSWSELASLEVLDSGEPIPRFADLVDAWPTGVGMNLDVHDRGVVVEALDHLDGFDDEILLSSTQPAILEASRDVDVPITRGYSFYEDPDASIERALALDCEYVHVHHELCLRTDLVESAHDAGLRVDAWSVDDAETLARLGAAGVDAVTVDRWDIA